MIYKNFKPFTAHTAHSTQGHTEDMASEVIWHHFVTKNKKTTENPPEIIYSIQITTSIRNLKKIITEGSFNNIATHHGNHL